jgi:hypothetical protein
LLLLASGCTGCHYCSLLTAARLHILGTLAGLTSMHLIGTTSRFLELRFVSSS